jgi:RHS repeat-associated protein
MRSSRQLIGYFTVGLSVITIFSPASLLAQKHPQPDTQTCGTPGNPCLPRAYISNSTFTPVTRGAESGPYTYQFTVTNIGNATGTFEPDCTSPTQVTCTPSPDIFDLVEQASRVVTVTYTTMGLGRFTQKHVVRAFGESGQGRSDSLTTGLIAVTGTPIATHFYPLDSMNFISTDTMQATFAHPSGVVSTSFRLLIDARDSTSRATVTSSGLKAVGLGLSGGYHSFGTYACAVSGRCDSLFTAFNETVNLAPSVLDDSLGIGDGAGLEGLLPGALPLPVDSLRGCPVDINDPEIRLTNPASYFTQPSNPGAGLSAGYIFRATALYDATLVISTATHDYTATDYTDCANSDNTTGHVHAYVYNFLTDAQYDWSYWHNGSTTDLLWCSYPYPDRAPGVGCATGMPVAPIRPSAALAEAPNSLRAVPRRWKRPGDDGSGGGIEFGKFPRPRLQSPGAINPSTYKIWLNGTLIVDAGQPVAGMGVTKVSADLTGAKYTMPTTSALIHKYNLINPPADNGGWNELIASVADSTNHRSYVRARFAVGSSNGIAAPVLKPLRDFAHSSQADCAAFGAIQCGGVMLTQTIPGFVTRDKDRSLHLVYRSASQRAPALLPIDYQIFRSQAAPDSVRTWPTAGVVVAGGTLRYYGTKLPAGVSDVDTLWENASVEHRVLGVSVDSGISANIAIRSITTHVQSFHPGQIVREDSLNQEVVYLQLSDSTMTRFGPGWQLAELQRLIFGQTSKGAPAAIWLTGDGSYTIFRQVGGVWQTPPGETAHLVDLGASGNWIQGAKYVLYLDNAASIGFRLNGWQAWTADPLANRTLFGWGGGTDSTRLLTITDPSGIKWEFTYTGTVVSTIAMRGTGSVLDTMATIGYDGNGRVYRVMIPRTASQTDTTKFTYVSNAPGAYVEVVTDPRSTSSKPIQTTFAYDTLYRLPIAIARPPDHFGTGNAAYRDPLRRAMPRANRGRGTLPAERMIFANWFKGTLVDFASRPTDFQVDKFGGPTYVNRIAPPAIMTPQFQVIDYGGDFVRRIERDTVGNVTKIVASADRVDISDSVLYQYDALGRVTRLIRNTLQWPIVNPLDTVTYVYDSVTVDPTGAPGKAWCSRLRTMTDVLGSVSKVLYDTTNTKKAGRCLPRHAIGIASDTTIFTYSLAVTTPPGVRPVSVRDPVGLVDSMQYDAETWNSLVHIRKADTATSRAYYNPFGWPDSTLDAKSVRTDLRYDLSGRVIRSRTGTSTITPTAASFYNRGGLVDSTEVYYSTSVEAAASGTIQTTKNYFDRLGQLDSTLTPGTAGTRRNHHFLRDRDGTPFWDFGGNGTYVGRVSDWQGRPTTLALGQVYPTYSVDGQPFADANTKTVYLGFGMTTGPTLSGGQGYWLDYDNKGRVIHERGQQVAWTVNPFYERWRSFNRVGEVLSEITTYGDGLTAVRTFEYNRRGQRTLKRDSLVIAPGKGAWASGSERLGSTRYFYTTASARLDSLIDSSMVDATTKFRVGRVRWLYDRAGRDTLRTVRIGAGSDSLATITRYDAAGRVSYRKTYRPAGQNPGTWYEFSTPVYNKVDDLRSFGTLEPNGTALPSPQSRSYSMTYDSLATRRLLTSTKTGYSFYTWSYDVFGNRLTEARNITTDPGCGGGGQDVSTYAVDNNLLRTQNSCSRFNHYYTDRAGNRLAQVDSSVSGGVNYGPQQIMSYTALNQLYFSMTPGTSTGTYDYNWHLYDAGGTRIQTLVLNGQSYTPGSLPADTVGQRTFYLCDGSDVELTVVKSGTTWWLYQRYITGGVDDQIGGRFAQQFSATAQNLALVADHQGSALAAIKADGTQETNALYYSRSPFGSRETGTGTGGSGSTNAGTGFSGASSPNAGGGGFVYLRNRWYDPKTGRFLTQDPIGLAGGVNLYSYAGNNPVAYSDPFGLCPPRNTNVNDCGNDLIGRAFKVLGTQSGPVGVKIIQAIVAHHLRIYAVTGSRVSREAGEPTIGVSYGTSAYIAQGLRTGAAAAAISHEVTHLTEEPSDPCQGEVNATNNELDVYDAQPAGDKENTREVQESQKRSSNPGKYDERVYRSTQQHFQATNTWKYGQCVK